MSFSNNVVAPLVYLMSCWKKYYHKLFTKQFLKYLSTLSW